MFALGKGKKWTLEHSPLYLDFLAGNQEFLCTPWGMPTRNVFGWQKPCYLVGEGYVSSFKELMETTDWDSYGTGRYEKCANCMAHCGYEPTAADAAIRNLRQGGLGGDPRSAHDRTDGAGNFAGQSAPGGIRARAPRRLDAGQAGGANARRGPRARATAAE